MQRRGTRNLRVSLIIERIKRETGGAREREKMRRRRGARNLRVSIIIKRINRERENASPP
jgi:hypothetical protein